MPSLRIAVPVASALTVAGIAATATLYGIAFGSLSAQGPNVAGYGLLLDANDLVVVDAGLLAASGAVLTLLRPSRWIPAILLAVAGVGAGIALGLQALGGSLAMIEPTRQPIDLNSLLLAVAGTGSTLLPAPVLAGIGAAIAVAIPRIRASRRPPVPAPPLPASR